MQETQVWSLGEDSLEKKKVIHFSILAWETPWTEKPGGLQSMGTQKSQTWLNDKSNKQQLGLLYQERE